MKRHVGLLMILGIFGALFIGCGDKDKKKSSEAAKPAEGVKAAQPSPSNDNPRGYDKLDLPEKVGVNVGVGALTVLEHKAERGRGAACKSDCQCATRECKLFRCVERDLKKHPILQDGEACHFDGDCQSCKCVGLRCVPANF